MRKEAELELIQSGIITADDIATAKTNSRSNRISILLNLMEGRSAESCESITEALAQHYKIPLLSLDKTTPPHQLMKLCDAEQARKLHFLPIVEHGDQAIIGMVDPLDLHYDDEIRAIFQKSIQTVFISMSDFERNYYRFFRKGVSLPAENPDLMNTVALTKAFLNNAQTEMHDDKKDIIAKKFAATIIARALAYQASSFSIEPQQDICLVNLTQDGTEYNLFRFSISNHKAMIAAMMRLAKIDPGKSLGVDQFSRCKVKYQGKQYILAYSFRQTPTGERIVVHVIDPYLEKLTIEDLGLPNQALDPLKKALAEPGLILVTGSSGSGKSTMLQVMTRYAGTLDKNIFTIEDIVGLKIEGVRQLQVKPQGPSKSTILQKLQANNADVIIIDAVDDKTIPAIFDAVESGCLILLAMNAADISKALAKLLRSGISRSRIASALKLVSTHKLIRKLCPACKTTEKIHPSTMVQWQISEHLQFQTANGCETCNHKAYRGTISLSEQLAISPDIADLIKQGASGPEIFEAGRSEGMLMLIEQGINKALDGTTSLEEVLATIPYHEPFSVKNRMRMGRVMPLKKTNAGMTVKSAKTKESIPEISTKEMQFSPSNTDDSIAFSTTDTATKQTIIKDEEKPAKAVEAAPQSIQDDNKANILLVDDSPVTLEFTRHILNVSGHFNVDVADAANKGLEMLQGKQYHLVITDQEMPGQTGQEFIEIIRQHSSFNNVGTILLTGNLNEMLALEGGADGYIAKPTDPELLIARAKSISDIYKRLSNATTAKPASPMLTTSAKPDVAEKIEFTEKDMAKISTFELDTATPSPAAPQSSGMMVKPEENDSEFDKLFE